MEISTSSNIVTIKGNIKNLDDHQDIKETIDKLVLKDGVNLSINVGDAQLKEVFDDLNLTTLFKVRKV